SLPDSVYIQKLIASQNYTQITRERRAGQLVCSRLYRPKLPAHLLNISCAFADLYRSSWPAVGKQERIVDPLRQRLKSHSNAHRERVGLLVHERIVHQEQR